MKKRAKTKVPLATLNWDEAHRRYCVIGEAGAPVDWNSALGCVARTGRFLEIADLRGCSDQRVEVKLEVNSRLL